MPDQHLLHHYRKLPICCSNSYLVKILATFGNLHDRDYHEQELVGLKIIFTTPRPTYIYAKPSSTSFRKVFPRIHSFFCEKSVYTTCV